MKKQQNPERMHFATRKSQKIVMIGILLFSLVMLIAGIEEIDFKSGQSIRFFDFNFTSEIVDQAGPKQSLLNSLLFGVSIIFIGLLVYLLFSPRLWKRVLKIAITVLSFYVLIYILIRRFHLLFNSFSSASRSSEDSVLFTDLVDSFRIDPPDSLVFLISFIFVLGGMIGIYLFWKMRPKEESVSKLEHLSDKAQEALDQIKTGKNLKNTIIRCYAEMSDALNHHQNIQRSAMMTPREFERILLQYSLPQKAIKELTHLFELVRYGNKELGEAEEGQCVECLTVIIQVCHEQNEETKQL